MNENVFDVEEIWTCLFFSYKIISRIASQSELASFLGGLSGEKTFTICVESNDT